MFPWCVWIPLVSFYDTAAIHWHTNAVSMSFFCVVLCGFAGSLSRLPHTPAVTREEPSGHGHPVAREADDRPASVHEIQGESTRSNHDDRLVFKEKSTVSGRHVSFFFLYMFSIQITTHFLLESQLSKLKKTIVKVKIPLGMKVGKSVEKFGIHEPAIIVSHIFKLGLEFTFFLNSINKNMVSTGTRLRSIDPPLHYPLNNIIKCDGNASFHRAPILIPSTIDTPST